MLPNKKIKYMSQYRKIIPWKRDDNMEIYVYISNSCVWHKKIIQTVYDPWFEDSLMPKHLTIYPLHQE